MLTLARSLFRDHMDVFVRSGREFETQNVEHPGRWMAPEQLQRLSDDLVTVASKTLPRGALTYGAFSGDPERMKSSGHCQVVRSSLREPIRP